MRFGSRPRAQVLLGASLLVCTATASGEITGVPPTQTAVQARSLAASCAGCHGTDGAAVPGGAMAALAGYPREALVTQMRAFRDGGRDATVMHQIARGYTDRQIEVLADYFASRSAGQP